MILGVRLSLHPPIPIDNPHKSLIIISMDLLYHVPGRIPKFKEYMKISRNDQLISEGLIATFDTDLLVQKIENLLGNKLLGVRLDPVEDEKLIFTDYGMARPLELGVRDLSEDEIQKLKKLFSLFGYHIANKDFSQVIQLEPGYPMIVTEYLKKKGIKELFHITTKDNAEFIEKDGLLPRPPESGIEHPSNRIYLICQETPTGDILIKSLADSLMRARGLPPEDAVIFSVPFEADREYYIDETATLGSEGVFAVFTFKGISRNKIHRMGCIISIDTYNGNMKTCDKELSQRYSTIIESQSIKLNTTEIYKTINRLKAVLNSASIPFYLTGGAAMAQYGLFRYTDDADIVVYGDRKDVIDYLSIRGFKEIPKTNILVDRINGIEVDILPGGGKVGPVRLNFPVPEPGEELIGLSDLISLKLDCYACNGVSRTKDLGDVVELIKINKLPREFPVDPIVVDQYQQLWDELDNAPSQ